MSSESKTAELILARMRQKARERYKKWRKRQKELVKVAKEAEEIFKTVDRYRNYINSKEKLNLDRYKAVLLAFRYFVYKRYGEEEYKKKCEELGLSLE